MQPQTVWDRYRGDPRLVAVGDVLANRSGCRLRVIIVYSVSKRVVLMALDPPARFIRTYTLSRIANWLVIESPRDARGG